MSLRCGQNLGNRVERSLSDAETIAERGSMLIWRIAAALERLQLYFAVASSHFVSSCLRVSPLGNADVSSRGTKTGSEWLTLAQEKLDETKQLVKQTEKQYEPHVPDWADWELPEYMGVFQRGEIVGYHCRNEDIKRLQDKIDALSES